MMMIILLLCSERHSVYTFRSRHETFGERETVANRAVAAVLIRLCSPPYYSVLLRSSASKRLVKIV